MRPIFVERVEPELRQVGNRQVKCHTPLNAQGEPSNV